MGRAPSPAAFEVYRLNVTVSVAKPQTPGRLYRFNQLRQQGSPSRQFRKQDRLVRCMCTLSHSTQPIQRWNPQAGREISIRAATHRCLFQLPPESFSNLCGLAIKTRHPVASLHRRTIYPSRDLQLAFAIERLQRSQLAITAQRHRTTDLVARPASSSEEMGYGSLLIRTSAPVFAGYAQERRNRSDRSDWYHGEHFNRILHHSITSFARPSTLDGMARPSAFAVVRLTTVSYFSGVCTAMSAGRSPLRMRST